MEPHQCPWGPESGPPVQTYSCLIKWGPKTPGVCKILKWSIFYILRRALKQELNSQAHKGTNFFNKKMSTHLRYAVPLCRGSLR